MSLSSAANSLRKSDSFAPPNTCWCCRVPPRESARRRKPERSVATPLMLGRMMSTGATFEPARKIRSSETKHSVASTADEKTKKARSKTKHSPVVQIAEKREAVSHQLCYKVVPDVRPRVRANQHLRLKEGIQPTKSPRHPNHRAGDSEAEAGAAAQVAHCRRTRGHR